MFDKKLAGPVSQHYREKEDPAFDFWAPIARHHRIMTGEAGRVRKIAPDAVPRCRALQGDFAHPTSYELKHRRMASYDFSW
jgi:hypothetical protein